MERYGAAGRNVLDDTAAHPESFRATFEVAALQAAPRTVVVYAVRGNRGVDINRRNALAIADLCREFAVDRLVVTAAGDAVTALDRVSAEEAEAARAALDSRGCACAWHETLAGAIREALDATRPGDLLMLTGAQGMNEGKRMLELGSGGTSPRTTSTSTG
jgi:UDP-N-acetylmuramoyl-L-alanyl-D-glutamate--2,6-diaminopimelate ligase